MSDGPAGLLHLLLVDPRRTRAANDTRAQPRREGPGVLGGVQAANLPRDPFASRAAGAMRADPKRRWTVAALARVAGLSRAAFARRFTRDFGVPPLRWLAAHRLELARQRLLESEDGLAGIAAGVGYESEFSFSKAFKRRFGVSPGAFRRRVVSADTTTLCRAA